MHARIHRPHGSSNGACIRAYIAIYGGIYGPHGSSNGAAMGMHARIHGHIWGQQWGMHTRIHSHIWGHTWAPWEQQWGSNGACMRAYMAIYGAGSPSPQGDYGGGKA